MAKQKTAATVAALIQPVFEDVELELVDVTFTKERNGWYLRIFIDKPGGVDIEDCQNVSREIELILDETDPIPQSYILEVSSPGIERPLKKPADYDRFSGSLANITTYAPLEGKKNFRGRLIGLRGSDVVLAVNGSEIIIPFEQVAGAHLEVEF
ncbi:Ribosome maturation factor RimP [Pelotomaculum schinkii]|uniref:Ribosome maturation factor RimP n=1 Tax=Pelotomaculum schinkii TaxID=78350 RepID=A0A4Y7RDG0_9FIRM|nr:ribosome maturation factor RimP [Pelotomaculum schinkii]TEB06742.1 Ribosome maturation factor RimP [Pelotomaculum schinkii]